MPTITLVSVSDFFTPKWGSVDMNYDENTMELLLACKLSEVLKGNHYESLRNDLANNVWTSCPTWAEPENLTDWLDEGDWTEGMRIITDGHHRIAYAKYLGYTHIPMIYSAIIGCSTAAWRGNTQGVIDDSQRASRLELVRG